MKIIGDGGLGAKRLGAGTFNFVVELDRCHLPAWLPSDSVLRITRPDRSEGDDHKYQSITTVADEAHNAMYASANGFGFKVYAIAAFEGIRMGRTLRYGMVYALEKAERDMSRTLESLNASSQAIQVAKNVTEMLYQASRKHPGDVEQHVSSHRLRPRLLPGCPRQGLARASPSQPGVPVVPCPQRRVWYGVSWLGIRSQADSDTAHRSARLLRQQLVVRRPFGADEFRCSHGQRGLRVTAHDERDGNLLLLRQGRQGNVICQVGHCRERELF
eukprot:5039343-Prymnesium_polylepis.3